MQCLHTLWLLLINISFGVVFRATGLAAKSNSDTSKWLKLSRNAASFENGDNNATNVSHYCPDQTTFDEIASIIANNLENKDHCTYFEYIKTKLMSVGPSNQHSKSQISPYSEDTFTIGSMPDSCSYEANDSKVVICEGTTIDKVPWVVPRSLSSLTFKNTSIQILDVDNAKNLPRVERLVFTDGILVKFDGYNFLQLQPYLLELHIINNHIYEIPFFAQSAQFPPNELQVLNLQNNDISFLPTPSMTNSSKFEHMEYMSLEGNHLSILPSQIFYPFRDAQLKILSLRNCALFEYGLAEADKPEDRSPFRFLQHLQSLDLSENPYLDSTQFAELFAPLKHGNLTTLLMSGNNYQVVPRSGLKKVSHSLITLDLKFSSLICIDSTTFPRMTELKTLNLESSRITRISPNAFDSLPQLEALALAGNLLVTLPDGISLPTLKVLFMGSNPAEYKKENFKIKELTFTSLANLEALSMKKNKIAKLHSSDFFGLSALKALELSSCDIGNIYGAPFISLAKLKYLWLSDNKLTTLNALSFRGLDNLYYLDLSGNQLQLFTPNLNIPLVSVEPLMKNWSLEVLSTHYDISDSENIIQSSSFAALNGLSKLCYLDLEENDIRYVRSEMFSNLISLVRMNLSKNRIQEWSQVLFANNTHLVQLDLRHNEIKSFSESMQEDICERNISVYANGNTLVCGCDLVGLENCAAHIVDLDDCECYNEASDQWMLVSAYLSTVDQYTCASDQDDNNIYVETTVAVVILILVICVLIIIAAITFRNRWYVKYILYKYRIKYRATMNNNDAVPYIYDIFVSYSHHDRQWVFEKLITKLEMSSSKLKVCVHERDFVVGQEITQNIVNCVQNSRKVLVIVSKEFLKSNWCMLEFNITSSQVIRENSSKLIVIMLEDIPPTDLPSNMQHLFLTVTYIHWKPTKSVQRHFWARLNRAIFTPTKESPASQPASPLSKYPRHHNV